MSSFWSYLGLGAAPAPPRARRPAREPPRVPGPRPEQIEERWVLVNHDEDSGWVEDIDVATLRPAQPSYASIAASAALSAASAADLAREDALIERPISMSLLRDHSAGPSPASSVHEGMARAAEEETAAAAAACAAAAAAAAAACEAEVEASMDEDVLEAMAMPAPPPEPAATRPTYAQMAASTAAGPAGVGLAAAAEMAEEEVAAPMPLVAAAPAGAAAQGGRAVAMQAAILEQQVQAEWHMMRSRRAMRKQHKYVTANPPLRELKNTRLQSARRVVGRSGRKSYR